MFASSALEVSSLSEVTVSHDPSVFNTPGWRRLLGSHPRPHLFATPEWNRTWWDEFHPGKELFVLTIEREGTPMAIVPLYRKIEDGRKVFRFVGGIDLTDYLGPICAPDDRAATARILVDWLVRTEISWDEFDAHNLPVPEGFADALIGETDRAGLEFRLDEEETAAVLRLPDSFEEYLSSLSSKERHELKRKRRRIARDHPDVDVRTATNETLEADLKIFVEMHRGAEGHKGHFMKPEIATFFERLAREFDAAGWLRLDLLEVAGKPIASTFAFEVGRDFYLYNSAYEPDFRTSSPGFILVAELIEDAIERGLKVFDFLRGPERYKYQLGSEAVPLYNVRIFAPGTPS